MNVFWVLISLLPLSLFSADSHQHHHGHGNPKDLRSYIKKLEDPDRDQWQRPFEVFKVFGLKAGDRLCDIGSGPGYLSLKAASVVAEIGQIFAVDVEEVMVKTLAENILKNKITNVTPILGLYDNPLLPIAICDYILIVNTYHHFENRIDYLKTLKRSLAPNGKLINIDFFKKELPFGPKVEHKVSEEEFLSDATKAGYKLHKKHDFLQYQYFFELAQ